MIRTIRHPPKYKSNAAEYQLKIPLNEPEACHHREKRKVSYPTTFVSKSTGPLNNHKLINARQWEGGWWQPYLLSSLHE